MQMKRGWGEFFKSVRLPGASKWYCTIPVGDISDTSFEEITAAADEAKRWNISILAVHSYRTKGTQDALNAWCPMVYGAHATLITDRRPQIDGVKKAFFEVRNNREFTGEECNRRFGVQIRRSNTSR